MLTTKTQETLRLQAYPEYMNDDIRNIRDTQYETRHEITGIKQRLTTLEADVSVLKQDVAVLKSDVVDLKNDMKKVRQDMKDLHGEVREIAGSLSGMQTRLNWWLVIAGVVIAALQYFIP